MAAPARAPQGWGRVGDGGTGLDCIEFISTWEFPTGTTDLIRFLEHSSLLVSWLAMSQPNVVGFWLLSLPPEKPGVVDSASSLSAWLPYYPQEAKSGRTRGDDSLNSCLAGNAAVARSRWVGKSHGPCCSCSGLIRGGE